MNKIDFSKFKIKPLTKEQIIISIDRLTRFKHPKVKYMRVFCDVITHNLIYPKFKKSELENMDICVLRDYAQEIINYSLKELKIWSESDYSINKIIKDYEDSIFHIDVKEKEFLNNQINYDACITLLKDTSAKNLKWLSKIKSNDLIKTRQNYSLGFPIELVVIAEGATEEILLPEFAKICGFDFDKQGVYLISAGGKNQVVKLYYELVEFLKIPIFVLLDKDGLTNSEEIEPKLRKIDRIHLLESGEFEDLLPFDLVKRTLDYELKNISVLDKKVFESSSPRVKFLEEVFKNRGMHEFKKVDFAKMIKNNLISSSDISAEISDIIEEIKNTKSYKKIK